MDAVYQVERRDQEALEDDTVWQGIQPLHISNYLWDDNGYRPGAEARLFYTATHLHLRLRAFEEEIRAECRQVNDMVCRDSCLEFFVNPNPEVDERYLNFELNPIGCLLLYIGRDRQQRVPAVTPEDLEAFGIAASVSAETAAAYRGPYWQLALRIPFAYLERHYGKMHIAPGKKMRANFYKCGNLTRYPHYACWSKVGADRPDFHTPQFFGELVLV